MRKLNSMEKFKHDFFLSLAVYFEIKSLPHNGMMCAYILGDESKEVELPYSQVTFKKIFRFIRNGYHIVTEI